MFDFIDQALRQKIVHVQKAAAEIIAELTDFNASVLEDIVPHIVQKIEAVLGIADTVVFGVHAMCNLMMCCGQHSQTQILPDEMVEQFIHSIFEIITTTDEKQTEKIVTYLIAVMEEAMDIIEMYIDQFLDLCVFLFEKESDKIF